MVRVAKGTVGSLVQNSVLVNIGQDVEGLFGFQNVGFQDIDIGENGGSVRETGVLHVEVSLCKNYVDVSLGIYITNVDVNDIEAEDSIADDFLKAPFGLVNIFMCVRSPLGVSTRLVDKAG